MKHKNFKGGIVRLLALLFIVLSIGIIGYSITNEKEEETKVQRCSFKTQA